MKKFLLLLFIIFSFVSIKSIYAESSATVNINNNISSSSDNKANVKTDIRVETNGHVTTYSSDKAENIEVKAVNDSSEIKINGTEITKTPTKIPTITSTPVPSEEEISNDNPIGDFEKILKEKLGFFKKFFSFLD